MIIEFYLCVESCWQKNNAIQRNLNISRCNSLLHINFYFPHIFNGKMEIQCFRFERFIAATIKDTDFPFHFNFAVFHFQIICTGDADEHRIIFNPFITRDDGICSF